MYQAEEQLTTFSIKNAIIVISVFFMIYMSSSFFVTVISGTFSLVTCLGCGFVVLIAGGKKKIDQAVVISVCVLCSCICFTSLIVGEETKDIIIMISIIMISLFFVIGLDYDQYCKIYTNIILIIALFSLATYLLSIVAPSIIRLFPRVYSVSYMETYNLGLTFVNLRSSLVRNMGIFWEPGAYQTYLVFAILLELFAPKKTRKFALGIFTLALITTWSTTGIIVCFLLILIYINHKNDNTRLKSVRIITAIVVLALIIAATYSILPLNIQYAMLGKITLYFGSDSSSLSSASVRFDSVTYPIKAFLKSPIIGVGYAGLKRSVLSLGHNMTTATPINWFTAYGTIFGLVYCIAIFRFARKLNNRPLQMILIIITIILSISTEEYLRNISITVFLLYGLSGSAQNRINTGHKSS